jgi:hypothetical protein
MIFVFSAFSLAKLIQISPRYNYKRSDLERTGLKRFDDKNPGLERSCDKRIQRRRKRGRKTEKQRTRKVEKGNRIEENETVDRVRGQRKEGVTGDRDGRQETET